MPPSFLQIIFEVYSNKTIYKFVFGWLGLVFVVFGGFVFRVLELYFEGLLSPKKEDLQILSAWLTIQHTWTQTNASLHWNQLTILINVCKNKSFQLYSHSLQLHKHTNAHHLYRSHLTQDRTTKRKPQSLPPVPELLVILTKWMSRTCLLLQCVFLESCSTPKENRKPVLLAPHMLMPWRDG